MEIIELTSENITQYLERCIEIQKHLVKDSESITESQFKETAKAVNTYFNAVKDGEEIMGIGVVSKIVHPVDTTGYVNNIVVHPDARGKGLFSLIMDDLEKKAKSWNCTDLALTCSREKVQGLYENRGYYQKQTNFYLKSL